ncbi:hypothetical protein RvY_09801 [Ramazzottius varieornatus]|uniref:Peptidase S54 rhomboid domain-containing protein n=1 Tax=Ramazzottius varieornatus TaxID=947166 RepID=A0A1D1VFZ9_RAMVA|nr:hypothetical protein RvY_09801 [Ramazzottius varieornatus]
MEGDRTDVPVAASAAAADAGGSSKSIAGNKSQLSGMSSLRRTVSQGVRRSQSAVAHFLGVETVTEEDMEERKAVWDARRATLARRLGNKQSKPAVTPSHAELGMIPDTETDGPKRELAAETLRLWKKPSVAQMAWKKVAKAAVAPSERPKTQPSLVPERILSFPATVVEEAPEPDETMAVTLRNERFFDEAHGQPEHPPAFLMAVSGFSQRPPAAVRMRRLVEPTVEVGGVNARGSAPMAQPEDETDLMGPKEIVAQVIKKPKRSRFPGMDFMSRICPWSSRFKRDEVKAQEEKLASLLDHRPYFTYWVTAVQILVLLVSIAVYGFAPFGFGFRQQSSLVLETSLALETVDYLEPENFWLGPRANHLIHLGAKYGPCMRQDAKIAEQIAADRSAENYTACCVRNDGGGCVQSSHSKCSKTMATFHKWPGNVKHSDERLSGSVCGLDPRYCEDPVSTGPHAWPDDITRWPVCKTKANISMSTAPPHMTCEVVGHPCCTGIRGECQITTREYCDFVQGYFHEDALLCSQVSCMDKICGMLPFLDPEVPDQFYRLWTGLFLHAGILHLLISVVFQYFIMRDAEKLIGWLRMALIYILSGFGGNLASAIFIPYVAEVGPSGSQFGVFACLFVEIIYSWKLLDTPWRPTLRMGFIALFLFGIGLFPWTDNYAHLSGFIFGFLLSLALLPDVAFRERNRRCRIWTILFSLMTAIALLAALFVLFYIHPVYDCEVCSYFNCIPFTENFCDNQKITIVKKQPN